MVNEIEDAKRFIFENIPDIAWFKDLNSRYIAVNNAFTKILGCPVEDVVGMRDQDLWPIELAQKYVVDDREVLATGLQKTLEESIIDKNGQIIWLETIKTPFRNSTGKLIGIIGISRDITARKIAESQLRKVTREFQIIFDAIPATLWFKDTKNGFVRVNKATTEFLGCSANDIQGKSAFDFFPKEVAEKYYQDDLEVIHSKTPKLGIIEEAFTTGGGLKIVRTDKIPSVDEYGNVNGLVAIAIDITDIKKAEKEREELLNNEKLARDDAIRANQAKDRFLAMLSHELRTPLTTILSWAELLTIGSDDSVKVAKGAAMIKRAAKAQAKLIDDLLDVSRIISGKLQIEISELTLTDPILLAIESLQSVAEAKEITIQTKFSKEICQKIIGDPTRLQQIFYNLLMNAIKFSPVRGKVIVSVKSGLDYYQVEIEDNGPGISPESLPRLFDPFWQADTSSTRAYGGLGLGLTIVRNLAEAHGGSVSVESRGLGFGAIFRVSLPSASNSPLKNQLRSNALSEKKSQMSPNWWEQYSQILKGVRILIVDDEESAREAFREILSSLGLEIRTANSVSCALKVLNEFNPAVLVSDIAMPGEDGYDLIRKVRTSLTSNRTLPAIALTAFASREDAIKALNSGFQAHLVKPVDIVKLIHTITDLTGLSQNIKTR